MKWPYNVPTETEWATAIAPFIAPTATGRQIREPDPGQVKLLLFLRERVRKFWKGRTLARIHGREYLGDAPFALIDLYAATSEWLHTYVWSPILDEKQKVKDKLILPLMQSLKQGALTELMQVYKTDEPNDVEKRLQDVMSLHIMDEKAQLDEGYWGGIHFPGREARYLSEDEVQRFRVYFKNGRAYRTQADPNGGVTVTVLDTIGWGGGDVAAVPRDFGCYVFTCSQVLYVSNQHSTAGRWYHSAYTEGFQVVCAGNIKFMNGLPIKIDNKSGHYWPGPRQMRYVVNHLIRKGIDVSKVIVEPYGGNVFPNALDYLRASVLWSMEKDEYGDWYRRKKKAYL